MAQSHPHRKVSFCNSAELICTDPAENRVLYHSSVPVPETEARGRPPLPKDADLPPSSATLSTEPSSSPPPPPGHLERPRSAGAIRTSKSGDKESEDDEDEEKEEEGDEDDKRDS